MSFRSRNKSEVGQSSFQEQGQPPFETQTFSIKQLKIKKQKLLKLSHTFNVEITVKDIGKVPRAQGVFNPKIHQAVIKALTTYILGPTIIDNFGHDHEARRVFYRIVEHQDPALFKWTEQNRMRYNNMFALSMIDTLIPTELLNPKLIAKLKLEIPNSANDFDKMRSNSQRIKTTNRIAAITKKIYFNIQTN